MDAAAAKFIGSIPQYYDRYLGPAWFDSFAADLAGRMPARPPGDALEVACGTGILTRRLREHLDPSVRLVASDLSKAMLDHARGRVKLAGIEWQEADGIRLPFEGAEFGAVVCSFGMMFMPDRQAAFREARRVLHEGGLLLFNVWDRIEENPHALANQRLFDELFPGDEEVQFGKIAFGMHDRALLRQLLSDARFKEVRMEAKRLEVQVPDVMSLATGMVRGTPRSLIFEKRGLSLDAMIGKVAAVLARVGGEKPYRSHAQAVIVEARAV